MKKFLAVIAHFALILALSHYAPRTPGVDSAFLGAIIGAFAVKKAQRRQAELINKWRDTQGEVKEFYKQYLGKGSPLLQERQRASAENVAGEFKGARESAMQGLAATGYGRAGSGTQAGMLGGMFQAEAKTGADHYLENLLQNEQFKFHAAQGMAGLFGNPAFAGARGQMGQQAYQTSVDVDKQMTGAALGAMGGGGGMASVTGALKGG